MKLWLLRPAIKLSPKSPWWYQYESAHGYVVRAETEQDARQIAADETKAVGGVEGPDAWLLSEYSTCVVLSDDGEPGVIMCDYVRG